MVEDLDVSVVAGPSGQQVGQVVTQLGPVLGRQFGDDQHTDVTGLVTVAAGHGTEETDEPDVVVAGGPPSWPLGQYPVERRELDDGISGDVIAVQAEPPGTSSTTPCSMSWSSTLRTPEYDPAAARR